MSADVGRDAAYYVVLHDSAVLVIDEPAGPRLPDAADLAAWLDPSVVRYSLGRFAGRDAHAISVADSQLVLGHRFASIRSLFDVLDHARLDLIGRALAIIEFETTHRYCGRCGAPTEPLVRERAKHCASCGLNFYPRIPPAVITLVEREGKLLLARSARFKPGMFSAVAGFVELGESLEAAAVRETREEVGVVVGDLRYFGSQPWPFGRSLMIGYFASHVSGEIEVDGEEIVEADWFDIERLPLLPPPISIARKLIDAFVAARQR